MEDSKINPNLGMKVPDQEVASEKAKHSQPNWPDKGTGMEGAIMEDPDDDIDPIVFKVLRNSEIRMNKLNLKEVEMKLRLYE